VAINLEILPDEEDGENSKNLSSPINVTSYAYTESENDYDHQLSSEVVYEFDTLTTEDWEETTPNETQGYDGVIYESETELSEKASKSLVGGG
jgi:hypothetical protein